jgi:hypothetical protein
MDRATGPLRAFRDRYVAALAGLSYDLAPRVVGVHPDHLALAPELPGREVLVSPGAGKPEPPSRRPAFRVVELDRLMRDALGQAAEGGVVFSVFDFDDPQTGGLLSRLRLGEPVYLNAAVDRLAEVVVKRPDGFAA